MGDLRCLDEVKEPCVEEEGDGRQAGRLWVRPRFLTCSEAPTTSKGAGGVALDCSELFSRGGPWGRGTGKCVEFCIRGCTSVSESGRAATVSIGHDVCEDGAWNVLFRRASDKNPTFSSITRQCRAQSEQILHSRHTRLLTPRMGEVISNCRL